MTDSPRLRRRRLEPSTGSPPVPRVDQNGPELTAARHTRHPQAAGSSSREPVASRPELLCVAWGERDERGRLTGREVWCYTLDVSPEDFDQVATACDYVVVLPWGIERRVATCPDCLALFDDESPR